MAQDKLEQALGADQELILAEFLDKQADVMDLIHYEFFREGVRLGLSLIQELQTGALCEICTPK